MRGSVLQLRICVPVQPMLLGELQLISLKLKNTGEGIPGHERSQSLHLLLNNHRMPCEIS